MINEIKSRIAANRSLFAALFQENPEKQIYWKPKDDKWCLLEIACHLLDEECEDFRQRLDYTLHKPGKTWPSIDPQGWVKSRNYAGKNFYKTVEKFLKERQKSVIWLEGLDTLNWENSYHHPQAGKLTAQQIIANWLAHDYLHIRQINAIKYQYLRQLVNPLKLHYAGDW